MKCCTDCGDPLTTEREEDQGLCDPCFNAYPSVLAYRDERDEADDREQQALDERGVGRD